LIRGYGCDESRTNIRGTLSPKENKAARILAFT
jgi:hypothetical protein